VRYQVACEQTYVFEGEAELRAIAPYIVLIWGGLCDVTVNLLILIIKQSARIPHGRVK
jgi:hypothetical protein